MIWLLGTKVPSNCTRNLTNHPGEIWTDIVKTRPWKGKTTAHGGKERIWHIAMTEMSNLDSRAPTNGYLEKKTFPWASTSMLDKDRNSDTPACTSVLEDVQREQNHDLTSHHEDDIDDSSSSSEQVYTGFYKYLNDVNHFRLRCGEFVNQEKVQLFVVVLIAINAIMMGIGTYSFVRNDAHLSYIFSTCDLVFLIIFTIELFLQFLYYGWKLLLDGWLLFDLVVIVTSWSFASTQVIRAFRIFRALRLVTRIKVLKNLISGKKKECPS